MKPVLLIAAALALVGAAPAGSLWTDAIPPERFQEPTIVAVAFLPADQVHARCSANIKDVPATVTILACTSGDGRIIVMPNPCAYAATQSYARLQCHEIAHTKGWSANHER